MLTKSMFTHSVLQDTKIQKKELGYFYGKYFINFFSLCALWHSSKIWQENKWSKYFGRKLTNFQAKLLQDEVTLSKIKTAIFKNNMLLDMRSEYQELVIKALIEMGIFHDTFKKEIKMALPKSYKERWQLLVFMNSKVFAKVCTGDFTDLKKELENTFFEKVTKPILEEGISLLHSCDLISFDEAEKKYRQVLLNIYPEITRRDEKFIASYKRDKLEQYFENRFFKIRRGFGSAYRLCYAQDDPRRSDQILSYSRG